jgi:hypothetical protein
MSSIMRRRSGLISAIGGLPFQGWGEAPKPWQTARPEPSATAERTSRVSGLVQSQPCVSGGSETPPKYDSYASG